MEWLYIYLEAIKVGRAEIAKQKRETQADHIEREQLKEHPIGDVKEQNFYVKSTYCKYIMGEDSSELIKRRVIRALQDVNTIRIDLIPTYSRVRTHKPVERTGIPKIPRI